MRRVVRRFAAVSGLLALSLCAVAQESGSAPRPPRTVAQVMTEGWQEIGNKLVEIAREFPEDKYGYKPTPEVRTFAEQIVHAATGNVYVAKIARGEKAEYAELERSKYPAKSDVVSLLKQSVDELSAILKSQADEQMKKRPGLWVGFLEHAGEHYGQLVVYYRLNGIVPPESRPKPKSD